MKLNIQTKLLGSFLIVIALAIGVGIFALIQMNIIYQAGDYFAINTLPSVYTIGQIDTKVNYYRRQQLQHILAVDDAGRKQRDDLIASTDADINKLISDYQTNMVSDATDKQSIDSIAAQWTAYKAASAPAIVLDTEGKDLEAITLLNGDPSTKLTALEATIQQSISYNQKLGASQETVMKNTVSVSQLWVIILLTAATLMALILALWQSRAISGAARQLANAARGIARGEMEHSISIHSQDEMGDIAAGFIQMIANIQAMVADANMLSKAAVEGKLDTRADASKHQGDFRKIVQGVDDTLDAVIGPLNVAANYVDRISKGDIPVKITDTYKGDFNTIKNNLNQCIDVVNVLVADADMLSKAAVEGKLATRADASKHQGDYRKIVQGVNDTLDAVIGPLNVSAGYVDRISKGDIPAKITDNYNGDFNTIKNNLNQCIDVVNALVADAGLLAKAAVDGKLETRADASKHQGDYRKIVQGVNDTLDAVIGPLNVAAGYVDLISKGEIPEKIVDRYNGDFNTIKTNLNNMLVYLEEMATAAGQIAEGDLTAEVNPRSKQDVLGNAFSKMIGNLNSTMQQTNSVTKQVVQAVEQVRSVSQDLASNAQEQSAAVEEVASSVEETDGQVKASADHANVANQLASQTTTLASVGQEKMKALSTSMNSIANSSQEISKIIKVIDDIAFQTNLLALNAAVEAARAGQYGKGFAVVAQEVRNLAERSAKAAKSTSELIEDSGRRVKEGVDMTNETAHSLNDIVQNIVKVKDLVGEIAAASEEQTKALNQISQAINQVSQGTQSNSTQSEELASTADEMGGLADRLRDEVERFKLRQGNEAVMSAQMLQTAMETLQKAGNNKKIINTHKAGLKNNGEAAAVRNVDRDERGYGKF